MVACKTAGATRVIPMPVSVPSHCSLMKPVAEEMASALSAVALVMPDVPVVQNVTAQPVESVESLRQKLVEQLYSPVLWTASVMAKVDQGVQVVVECGPGKVLSGLNRKVSKSLEVASLTDEASFEKALSLI